MLRWLYNVTLNIYPGEYLNEFRQEMMQTFSDTLDEARKNRWFHILRIWLVEILDIIPNAIREHSRRIDLMNDFSKNIKQKPDWKFYLLWFFLLTIAGPIAIWAGFIALEAISNITADTTTVFGTATTNGDFVGGLVMWPILIILTTAIQYLLLRRYIDQVKMWIPASILGWTFSIIIVYTLSPWLQQIFTPNQRDYMNFILLGTLGIILGTLQWLVLRTKFRYASLWIATMIIAYLSLAIYRVLPFISNFIEYSVFTMVPALVTALGLGLLFFLTPNPLENT